MIYNMPIALQSAWEWTSLIYFVIAFFCGCIAATAEIFSRYSDGPGGTFKFKEVYMYLGLNGIASLIVYAMIKKTNISFELLGNSQMSQAVLAGFSAMALLRSSVATIKHGQATHQVGFAPIMQAFLDKVDRAYDRRRSQSDLPKVTEVMNNIDFSKAAKDLPMTCLNLMQNVSEEESKKLGAEVADLVKSELSPQTKALNLGIAIHRVTGIQLLQLAVESLGDSIHKKSIEEQSGNYKILDYYDKRINELKKKFL